MVYVINAGVVWILFENQNNLKPHLREMLEIGSRCVAEIPAISTPFVVRPLASILPF